MAVINNSINAPIPFETNQGGTGVASPTIHGIMVAQGSSPVATKVLTDGQLLIGATGTDPVAANITAGSGITIVNGGGTLTISTAGGGFSFNTVSGTSATLAAANAYVSVNALLTTYTLPTTANLGDQYEIFSSTTNVGFSTVVPGTATQLIRLGTALSTAATGAVTGTAVGDVLSIVCVDATVPGSEVFQVESLVGNFNVT